MSESNGNGLMDVSSARKKIYSELYRSLVYWFLLLSLLPVSVLAYFFYTVTASSLESALSDRYLLITVVLTVLVYVISMPLSRRMFKPIVDLATTSLEREIALRASEEYSRSVINMSVEAIIVIDRNGIVQTLNPKAQTIFGYSDEEVVGQNVSQFMPEPYRSAHDGYLEAYLKTRVKKVIGIGREVFGLRRNGEAFPMLLRVAEMKQGEELFFIGFVHDITEQKRIEEERALNLTQLEEVNKERERDVWIKTGESGLNNKLRVEQSSEVATQLIVEYLAKYTDSQVGVIYLFDASKRELHATASYALKLSELPGKSVAVGEGVVGQVASNKELIVIKSVPDNYLDVSTGLGTSSPRNIVVLPMIYADEVVAVLELASLIDYTEVQLSFLKSVSEGIAISLEAHLSREEQKLLLVRTQEQTEELRMNEEEMRQSNEELEEQTAALKASEERLHSQQEELRRMNEELKSQTEQVERERYSVLEKNEELIAVQTLLKERAHDLELASAYKSEFLANMSHDLRTPLNSILILSEMLTENKGGEEALSPKQMEFATTINDSGKGLLSLIDDIMDLSKVEAGKLELTIESFSLQPFLEHITREYAMIAEEKGLELKTFISSNAPPIIQTDSQRIGQVIKNFLSNAFKFSDGGVVEIRIQRPDPDWISGDAGVVEGLKRQCHDADSTVAIMVIDSGIGIPSDKRSHVFGAFQQADGSTSRTYGGTGLGLSISRELSRLLGGEIRLESEVGEGSCFTLLIPDVAIAPRTHIGFENARSGDEPKTELEEQRSSLKLSPVIEPVSEKEDASRPPIRPVEEEKIDVRVGMNDVSDDRGSLEKGDRIVMIVEDDRSFARIVRDLCRDMGYKTIVLHHGVEVLSLAIRYTPNGILLDLGLPDISGVRVIERLKDNLDTRHIPVHVVSASDTSIESRKYGAAGVLRKPVDPAQLRATLNEIEDRTNNTNAKLLVVDDDPVYRTLVRGLIESEDVEVFEAETGEEGLKLIEEERFDCVVLDLTLPGMSGVEVLEEIRKSDRKSAIPVIIFSGTFLTHDERMVVERYADKIVVKGVGSPELLLDEATLFLHRVTAELPIEKQRMIHRLHDKEIGFQGRKILLVDDDMRNIYALSAVLEEKELEVVAAENGVEALEQLKEHGDVDMILMDIMMPEMDGYEAMRAIRKQKALKDIPIIALTAKAMKGDRAKCIEAGATDYLTKPIDTDKLLSILRVWLYR